MVNRKHWIVAGLAVLTAVLAVYLLLPGEKKKVKRQFDVLSQTVEKEALRKARETFPWAIKGYED